MSNCSFLFFWLDNLLSAFDMWFFIDVRKYEYLERYIHIYCMF